MESPFHEDGGTDLFNTFALAHELGQPLAEIARMGMTERAGWLAYFAIRANPRK